MSQKDTQPVFVNSFKNENLKWLTAKQHRIFVILKILALNLTGDALRGRLIEILLSKC